jgi:hypothetical protein
MDNSLLLPVVVVAGAHVVAQQRGCPTTLAQASIAGEDEDGGMLPPVLVWLPPAALVVVGRRRPERRPSNLGDGVVVGRRLGHRRTRTATRCRQSSSPPTSVRRRHSSAAAVEKRSDGDDDGPALAAARRPPSSWSWLWSPSPSPSVAACQSAYGDGGVVSCRDGGIGGRYSPGGHSTAPSLAASVLHRSCAAAAIVVAAGNWSVLVTATQGQSHSPFAPGSRISPLRGQERLWRVGLAFRRREKPLVTYCCLLGASVSRTQTRSRDRAC